jgi:hypothetical protein
MPLAWTLYRTGPAQAPDEAVEECAERKVLVSLRVKDAHQAAAFVTEKAVLLALSTDDGFTEDYEIDTDDNGYVTLEFSGEEGDLPARNVRVTWKENKRFGTKALTTAVRQNEEENPEIYSLTVPVAGTLKLEVDVKVWRPWKAVADHSAGMHLGLPGTTGTLAWQEPPGTAKNLAISLGTADAYATYSKADLPCATAITVAGPIPGVIVGQAWVAVDGGDFVAATDVDQVVSGVTFKRAADGAGKKVVVKAESHGTRVQVFIGHEFRKLLVVGEGTWFDYAVGLAEKYQTLAGVGLLWVYASQYDVTRVADLPTVHAGSNPATGAAKQWNQRTRVQGAQAKNLFVVTGAGAGGSFDATDSAHWDGVLNACGSFDAVVFNNPHPGYGLHECEVFGLKSWGTSQTFSKAKGRYISVQTFGYAVPAANVISDGNWTTLLQRITNGRFDTQYDVVANHLNYENRPTQTIPFFDAAGARFTWQIHQAFRYFNPDSAIESDPDRDNAHYGGPQEFGAATINHYYCT